MTNQIQQNKQETTDESEFKTKKAELLNQL